MTEALTAQGPQRRPKNPEDRQFEELHPRDALGKFIQKQGEVTTTEPIRIQTALGPGTLPARTRATVHDIIRGPDGKPRVVLRINYEDGSHRDVTVRPQQVAAVKEKARLDRQRAAERRDNRQERRQQQRENQRERRQNQREHERDRIERQSFMMKFALAKGFNPNRESLEQWRRDRWDQIERDARERGYTGNEQLSKFLQREREDEAKKRGWNPKTQSYKDWREGQAADNGWDPRKETLEHWVMRHKSAGTQLTEGQRKAIRRGWNPAKMSISQYRQRRNEDYLARQRQLREQRQERRGERGQTREERQQARQERRETRTERRQDISDAKRERDQDISDARAEREHDRARRAGESDEAYTNRQNEADWTLQKAERDAQRRFEEARLKAIRGSGILAIVAADWNPDLHPRGRDGKFIETLGLVQLVDFLFRGGDGRTKNLSGRRGKVVDIEPDPKQPGNPTIRVAVMDDTGTPRAIVNVKPSNIIQAREKGRLTPAVPDKTPDAVDNPDEIPDSIPDPAAQARARARGVSDDQLATDLATSDDATWKEAIRTEQANRAKRRALDERRRQELIAKVNADTANLSETDPELRSSQLDAVLSKLRFSIIDTDKVHDHLYPPGENSGLWTAERAAQHEEMWDELLASVESAHIPKEHDAFVLGGLPGAGKTFSLRPGQKAEGFGVTAWETNSPVPEGGATHVSINPDIVKEMLIDRGMLPEGIENLKPMEQVTFLHEESSYLAKLFLARLGEDGYNVVLDNTMDSPHGMLKRMTPLAREGYKFRGLFVDIPVDESEASTRKRYIDAALTPQGGRFVPSSTRANRGSTKGTMSKNRDAMDELVAADWFTDWMVIDNTGISSRNPVNEVVASGQGEGAAASAWLPQNDKNRRGRRGQFAQPTAPLPEEAPLAPAPAAPAA